MGDATFSLKQLSSPSRGEVLTDDGDGNAVTMSRKDFLNQANEYCSEPAS
ncbi:hypothetical protein GCM10020367_17470 [Streptomyces sannanensis]|uniref:DUF397 domain-containing protein n=1 Tax=Streptomyces sannanensis TaxID=285536 RepID=A0ABP6S8A6_9ACTN